MAANRTPDDRRIDAALLLTLWARSAERPREDAGDRVRLMKLAFLAEYRFVQAGIHGPNLQFYQWTWGPMSNEVCEAWDMLERAGMIRNDEHMVLTRRGETLADEFYVDVLGDERNSRARDVIESVARSSQEQPETAALRAEVEGLVLPGPTASPRFVRDVPTGGELLEPAADDTTHLFVDGGWRETLALLFEPAEAESVLAAVEHFRAGRIHVA